MKQMISALCMAFFLFSIKATAATAFFVTYKDGFESGGRGVTARLLKITDFENQESRKEIHYDLHLPDAHHTADGNFQFLTRLGVIDDSHVIFFCPNGHLYLFSLPKTVSDTRLTSKEHLSLGYLELGYWSQPAWYYYTHLPPACAFKQYSPISASRSFKDSNTGATHMLLACDEFSYLLTISILTYTTTSSGLTETISTKIRPLAVPKHKIRETEGLRRTHFSSALELVKSPDNGNSVYAIATMNPHYPKAHCKSRKAPFLMYQLDLSNTASGWKQTSASRHSSCLPLSFDNYGSAIIDAEKPYKSYSNGTLYQFTTDPKQPDISCFELSRHQYCVLYNPRGTVDSVEALTRSKNLIRVSPPRSYASQEGYLEGDREKPKCQPRITLYNGQLYSLVARNVTDEKATRGISRHRLCVVKAQLPVREQSGHEAVLDFTTIHIPKWEEVCDIPLPSPARPEAEEGTPLRQSDEYFPLYDQFVFFSPDDVMTVDTSNF